MRTFTFVCLLFIFSQTKSQTNWLSVHSYGEIAFQDYTNTICTDSNGYSYLTGTFNHTIIFGSDTLSDSVGATFLAMFDSSANPVWAKAFGGDNTLEINSSALDDSGHIYLAGSLRGIAIFGNDTVINSGSENLFLGKFDSNGNLLWYNQASGGMGNIAYGVAVNDSKVYITGNYDTSVTIGTTFLPGGPGNNIFVAQYDMNGNNLWARASSSSTTAVVNGIACDQNGNACITGYFRNSLTFGTHTITAPAIGGASVLLVQYGDTGNILWAKNSGGFPSSGYSKSIVSDLSGNYYCAGYFDSQIMIFENDTLTSAGSYDMFITKFDNSGNLIWAKREGGTDYDEGDAINVDRNGNAYVTGFFKGFVQFGSTFLSGPNQELYVVKFDSSGNLLWATSATGSLNERGFGIGLDLYNHIFISGDFTSPHSTFGSLMITNTDQFTGSGDIFFARLGESPTGIDDPQQYKNNNLIVFPNPSSGYIQLQVNYPVNSTLMIYTIDGRLVKEIELDNNRIELNLPPSIYFLQLKNNHTIQSCKLIVY
jgi:hypothetical protein